MSRWTSGFTSCSLGSTRTSSNAAVGKNDGGILRRLPSLQQDGSSKAATYPVRRESLATTHTQPDVGMMGDDLLVARATRSGAHGILCTPEIISLFEALHSAGTRRCDLVKSANCGSSFWALLRHSQEKARPRNIQRYDEACLLDSST